MGWQPGQSGNPHGKPTNENSFTYALRKALCENTFKVEYSDGKTLEEVPKNVVADYIAQAMVTGSVKLLNGTKMSLSPKDWWEMIWQAINRVDGAPLQQVDLSHQIEQIVFDAKQTLMAPEPIDVTEVMPKKIESMSE